MLKLAMFQTCLKGKDSYGFHFVQSFSGLDRWGENHAVTPSDLALLNCPGVLTSSQVTCIHC